MKTLHTPDQFTTPAPLIAMGVLGLVLAGALVVRAIDTGSGWQYLGTFLLVILSVRLLKRAMKLKK